MSTNTQSAPVHVLQNETGWVPIDFRELFEYRDLFLFLTWRQVKVLYAQTIMGLSWAILNPLIQILVFTVIFGKVAKLDTDGIPYFLFSTVAMIPWAYMSDAMTQSSTSLVTGQQMLGKIYFPRILFPLTPVFSKLVDFTVSIFLLIVVMFWYQVTPTWNMIFLPFLVLVMIMVPAAVGMWLSSLAIRFRDVKFMMPFVIKMLIYTAPILYSASAIPEAYRILYSLNPLVGVIEGYRACLLGHPMPWLYILPGTFVAVTLFVSGAMYFRKMERIVVDVI